MTTVELIDLPEFVTPNPPVDSAYTELPGDPSLTEDDSSPTTEILVKLRHDSNLQIFHLSINLFCIKMHLIKRSMNKEVKKKMTHYKNST